MRAIIKIVLAALLFLCLADMPYGYYQFVRFAALVAFTFLAFDAYQGNSRNNLVIYVVLAILFQPLLKISFSRDLWNIIDVIVAAFLIFTSVKEFKNKHD